MSYWRESFKGNRMSSKWRATRFSQGGQLDGVWTREVRDGKLYFKPVNVGTEASQWGERLYLPLNAPSGGDFIIEADWRIKVSAGCTFYPGVGVNSSGGAVMNGVRTYAGFAANSYLGGASNITFPLPWPGFPSQQVQPLPSDTNVRMRIVRKNGIVHLYGDNKYVGSYAYSNAITSLDLWLITNTNSYSIEIWVRQVSVWPKEAVL
jgi:hypothetical protein